MAAVVAALLVIVWLPTLAGPLMPRAVAERVGDAVLPGVAAQACVAEPGRKALARLTRPLVDAAEAEGCAVERRRRVLVVDVAAVNGMALPGGRVLLTRGLIEQARCPDEVAGVLAHELGHVIEAHPEQGMVRWLSAWAASPGSAALGGPEPVDGRPRTRAPD